MVAYNPDEAKAIAQHQIERLIQRCEGLDRLIIKTEYELANIRREEESKQNEFRQVSLRWTTEKDPERKQTLRIQLKRLRDLVSKLRAQIRAAEIRLKQYEDGHKMNSCDAI